MLAASLRGHSTGAALAQGCHALRDSAETVGVPQLLSLGQVVDMPGGVSIF